mmetsp:Transcript_11554/g.27553  ORF Transcript_11554/g.27553 Transcript_11554/m.27553 type:complete len:495 (-) Transcript_11554:222-1706(-)
MEMYWEPFVIVILVIYMGSLWYVLRKRCSRESTEDETRGSAEISNSSSHSPGQGLYGNESNDAGKISDDEKKYKRHQLIRSRMEYRQLSSTPTICEIIPKTSDYRVPEISQRDLESGVSSIEISQTALRQLTKMGYDASVCQKALKAVGGSDVEAAVYWIFEHKADKLASPSNESPPEESPPEGVPIIKSWEQNSDGGIRGQIYRSSNFEDGDFVETSKIVRGIIENNSVVATKSGSRYFLSAESANTAFDDDEVSTQSRFDSAHSRFDSVQIPLDSMHNRADACRYDCLACSQSRRNSANNSMRSQMDSSDSVHSRRDSASYSAQCRKDSLDSLHSRRDSADHSSHCRLDSLESAHNRLDIDSTIKSTQSFPATNPTTDLKSQEICSICLEPYRAGDIVVRLKQQGKVKDNNWFQDTLNQLKDRTSNLNYNEDAGSHHWFEDIVAQLKEATEEIQKSNNKPTTCNHWFHEECLLGWLEKNDECPLCRVNMIKD